MNGKRSKIINKTAQLLFLNKEYMSKYPTRFTLRQLQKRIKASYKRG